VATNKHAVIRYQTLDKCFRNTGRRYFIEDLIEACSDAIYELTGNDSGIKRRQILEDIKFMESTQGWNIPLERIRDGHKVYFKYDDKNFSINNQPLNETEANQLKEALQTLSRFKGLPQFEWVAEITARIDAGLSLSKNEQSIIEFEQNNYLKGLEFITPLYNAILYKQVVEITYKSFNVATQQTFTLHPYYLKQYNNRWFIFGLNDISDRLINLALDRFIDVQVKNSNYKPNTTINFNEYFEDIVGVTLPGNSQVQHIIVSVSNRLIPYIETKPLHGSQKIKERKEDYTIISFDLIPNYEFESLLLSYGEGVETIEPLTLRDKIASRVSLLNLKYN